MIIFNLLKLGITLKKMKFNTYMTILGLEMLVNGKAIWLSKVDKAMNLLDVLSTVTLTFTRIQSPSKSFLGKIKCMLDGWVHP